MTVSVMPGSILTSALSNCALLDSTLRPHSKVVLLAMLLLRDRNNLVAPGLANLGKLVGLSEATATKAVRSLREAGYIEMVHEPALAGRGQRQVFRVHVPPRRTGD